ncbi:MAG: tRNA epoxyqueuosine(34) reductase QueG [Planctomycetaceae bacterium]|nr:tRNA epoxyqueuosine(34) reductase QueG [Planctomycetaceae bacterium]
MISPHQLTEALRNEARRLGFCHVGACEAVDSPGFNRLQQWLQAGYAGQMDYLANRLDAYRHPGRVLDGAKSLLVLATDYRNVERDADDDGRGLVSRYAWGFDYHDVLRRRLNLLADFHAMLAPGARARGVVDTAPLMEREFAVLAGLGWIGKNTLLLTRDRGSWLFLSVLLTTAELEYDAPFKTDHCGTCRACIDACPTGALVRPYVLDARRCISYLTIELRDMPPPELRQASGKWLFGCDVCQEVCPWNRRANRRPVDVEAGREFLPIGGETALGLAQLFSLDDEAFRLRFRKTPLWRTKRRGLLRNAALILAGLPSAEAVGALSHGLSDRESLVRVASAWALGQIGSRDARTHLWQRLAAEDDSRVREAICEALGVG